MYLFEKEPQDGGENADGTGSTAEVTKQILA
jgi:hypothetical protein